ncbi:MAG: type IV secretion system DNA-binding domain-containing protein [Parcubacteria group bacterium]|nr:type IV secretion system DNA-binding domain-containing protein [Parcubacteria group bacterium]
MNDSSIVFFGETNFRNKRVRFGIKPDDRRRHMYIIGKTGMGKTEILKNMAIQDIQMGHGLAFVDPHGDTADSLLDYIPAERVNDVIYFDPSDVSYPIGFNIMEQVNPEYRHLVAAGVMGVFKKIWVDVWSARMEYILNNTILALLEYPGSTLLGINRMLADKEYRKKVVEKVQDPVVKAFWVQEFAKYTDRLASEATAAIQNKVGQFTSATLIRNIVGQEKSALNMREIMDSGKILILNLSKGKIGEDTSRLLGALMVTRLQLAAMSRVDILEPDRKDFYLYVDEFQNFATESFASILSEARKYKLNLILAHQYIMQMDEKVRDAVFGNVGTLVTFRVGAEDAEALEKEFAPEFTIQDIVNLGKWTIYLKLMIDGIASKAFSAATLPPMSSEVNSFREAIVKASREHFGGSREKIEAEINLWAEPIEDSSPRGYGRPESSRSNRQDNFSRGREGFSSEPKKRFDNDVYRAPKTVMPQRKSGIGLEAAFKQGAVDFKGRPVHRSLSEGGQTVNLALDPALKLKGGIKKENQDRPEKDLNQAALKEEMKKPDIESLREVLEKALSKNKDKPS